MRTPIEIALDIDSDNMTTAKKLYAFLELAPQNYARWCKTNITDNEFAEENVDYWAFFINEENSSSKKSLTGRGNTDDYKLTAHFAKKLSVKGNSARAEEAREYFTTLEEKVKQKAIDRTQLSPQLQSLFGLIETQARQELEQKRQAEQLNRIEHRQQIITEALSNNSDDEDFQKWVSKSIARIAESSKFVNGGNRSQRYACVTNESYERLNKKRPCRLEQRVREAKGRALENNPTIKKAELNKINKLYVISHDKDLKTAYELALKEMIVYYCSGVA